ncbi:MAG: calcium-binding protein [Myxococcota bacterium]
MAVSTGLLLALATTAEVQASSGVTATVTAVTGGSLVEVSGTNGVDTVTFEEDGANYIVTSNGVTIATTSDPVRVIFEGKDGGDYFSNETDIPSTVYGGEGNDFLYGGNVDDIIYGNKGADYIECGAGDDVVYGGNGSDEIYGGDDNDELWGEEDADAIYGGAGSDTLRGGKGDDTLVGQDDVDYIYGGNGNDDMLGCGGNDHVYGQSGSSDESDCGNDNNDTACVAEDDTAFQSNDSLCS